MDHQSLTVHINLPLLYNSWSFCICIWRGSYSEGMPSLPSSLIPLLLFSVPNPRMNGGITIRPELPRIAYECTRIDPNRLRFSCEVEECISNLLRIRYEFFKSGFRGRSFEQLKTFAPNSRLTYELQEVTTNYKIQLRTSRIDYGSATNPKIYQFVAIRGSSGRNGIPARPVILLWVGATTWYELWTRLIS